MKILPFVFAAISVIMPVISQKTGLSEKHGFPLKMLCAFLYLTTGVFSAVHFGIITMYSDMILAALGLGLMGDFFLEYKNKKFFPVGAAFFGIGHIVYSYTFLFVGDYKAQSYIEAVIGIILVLTVLIILFAKTKLSLKGKKKLILGYAPVLIFAFISALFSGGVAIIEGNRAFGLCLIAAGTLFFLSDVMIGMGKGGIKRPDFLHNAVSYTYFTAQTLFALSIYFQ